MKNILIIAILASFVSSKNYSIGHGYPLDLVSYVEIYSRNLSACPTGTPEQVSWADQILHSLLYNDHHADWRLRMRFRMYTPPGGTPPVYNIVRLDGPEHQTECNLIYGILTNIPYSQENDLFYKVGSSYVIVPRRPGIGRRTIVGFSGSPSVETAVAYMY